MRKKRFLAIVAAITLSISFTVPVTVFATEVEEDVIDDEQEEGEQTTIVAPDADSEDTSSGEGDTSGSSSGNSAGSSSGNSAGSTSNVKSSDSSLAHLGISPGTLSPAFSAGTHEYTATVDADVTAISVAAKPGNSKAVIASVSGAKSLTPGANTVKVVVEAENGATSTYSITDNCGGATAAAQPTPDDTVTTDTEAPEGEISVVDTPEEGKTKESKVTFDDNGYLIDEGNAYIPSSMMPEGEYVSLDKYNKLYEQAQTQKTKYMRILIVLIVLLVLALIVILNLALKLRDARQDEKLGLTGIPDDEQGKKQKTKAAKPQKETREKTVQKTGAQAMQTDTSMIPGVKMPDEMKTSRTEKASNPQRSPKPEKPVKTAKSAKKMEDLEILDLNDL